jgi:hypothetical protein
VGPAYAKRSGRAGSDALRIPATAYGQTLWAIFRLTFMRLLDKLSDLFWRLKLANVHEHFKSTHNLFNIRFDENSVYSKKRNSFYSFHNLKDDCFEFPPVLMHKRCV